MTKIEKCEKLIEAIENRAPHTMGLYMDAFPRGYAWAYAVDRDNCSTSAQRLRELAVPGWSAWYCSGSKVGHEVVLMRDDVQVNGCSKLSEGSAMLICILKAMIEQERSSCN